MKMKVNCEILYRIAKCYMLFSVGFCTYSIIEVLFRGYTYFTMGVAGGVIFLILDQINNIIPWELDLLLQGCIGSLVITMLEFIIGSLCIMYGWPRMWDYSEIPLNYRGIICVPFSLIWIIVSVAGIILADCINYYLLDEDHCPQYSLLGRKIILKKRRQDYETK